MKKWRCKIDTPWGKKGEEVPDRMQFSSYGDCARTFYPESFPDLFEQFEQVEEKSDEDLLNEYLIREYGFGSTLPLCIMLLSHNAINPEFLKMLRGEV